MSIFSELLPKINEISKAYTKSFDDELKAVFECFDKFEEEFQNGRSRTREKTAKDKLAMTTLQSINEDEDETNKVSDTDIKSSSSKSNEVISCRSSTDSNPERRPKKRSKNEVDDMSSPEQDKRQKRNASVKAQGIISKQVNLNLNQKLRRETTDKQNGTETSTHSNRSRRRKDEDKENDEPNEAVPVVQIKQEKVSIPPEPMDTESLPVNIEVKREVNDEVAMPPPVAPVPKPRKAVPAAKVDESTDEDTSSRRRTTRTKKQTDVMPPPPAPVPRATRASSRARRTEVEETSAATDARPKRTRGRKKQSEVTPTETEKDTQSSQESISAVSSPAEKPRPKRTRRAQKAADKEEKQKKQEEEELKKQNETQIIEPIKLKEERISNDEISSPILQKDIKIPKNKNKTELSAIEIEASLNSDKLDSNSKEIKVKMPEKSNSEVPVNALDETHIITTFNNNDKLNSNNKVIESKLDETHVINKLGDMDQTVVLPNGVYNHAPVTPKSVTTMNATVVLEAPSDVLSKQQNAIMDATVVLDKAPTESKLSEDNSLLTDDSDYTPPRKGIPVLQPTSAVKEKVQQFEELASRVTRTKTRAMKKDEPEETHTPPDKISKPVLSAETLTKMNSLIFNGKHTQISSSATKPRANMPSATKPQIPASTSKLSAINKAKEAAEESLKREDARRKKEALLEAKREMQKRKREEKMAAAAAAREAAERERLAAAALAAEQRRDKQAHADRGKMERVREAERKKQELARKVAETEERRRAEEAARMQRLADEQRRAEAQRKKQIEEQEAMKKEAAIMAKEIEKRQKEYIEKQKMKQRMEEKIHTPLRNAVGVQYHMEPVYMCDGFQYLNSDEDEEPPPRPIPEWSTSKARKLQLDIQSSLSAVHIDRLFSVRVHSPDLREIFPNIDRARLKRTSSAVWRTPPHLHAHRE